MADAISAVSRGVMATLVDGTIRVKIDIEPGDAAAAFAMLGMPGAPVAIVGLTSLARLVPARPEPEKPEPTKPKGAALARLAGMWCDSPEFHDWLAEAHGAAFRLATVRAKSIPLAAAEVVRELCGVESRAQLDSDPVAAGWFNKEIREPYMKFLEASGGQE